MSNKQPAAWGMENDDGQIYDCITPDEHAKKEGQYTVALYRKREWVGLTPEDKEEIQKLSTCYEQAVELTEAKLKELNT